MPIRSSQIGLLLFLTACAAGNEGAMDLNPVSRGGAAPTPDPSPVAAPSHGGSGLMLGPIDPNAMTPVVPEADGPSPVVPCGGPCTDFPAEPMIDPKAMQPVPANVATRFLAMGGGQQPCVFEPEEASLYPRNWLRPRVNFTPAPGQDLFEVRLHTEREANDLVVYTTNAPWYMPKELWTALTSHVGDEWNLTLSVRTANSQTAEPPSAAAQVMLSIAPAEASGTLVYWTSTGGTLKGFQVGDENVVDALVPSQVQQKTASCIGCHTSTPDGKFAGFVVPEPRAATPPNQNTFTAAIGSLEPASAGTVPSFLGAGARAFMDTAQTGLQAYSAAHWKDGDHIMIAQSGRGHSELFWVDLEATTATPGSAFGTLKRAGDQKGAGAPVWAHDGSRVYYVSTDNAVDGRIDGTDTDIYSIPYADKQGGDALKLQGAAEGQFAEYYPAISHDDQLIAFNRVPNGVGIYNSPAAEVFVVPAAGGTATRLIANDPPSCTHWPGPGPSNTWPKWSPEEQTIGGTSYYFLVFASTRNQDYRPQLHMTGVSVDESGAIRTHGAIQIWNQPKNESNHTPAWDVFKIPKTPEPPVVK